MNLRGWKPLLPRMKGVFLIVMIIAVMSDSHDHIWNIRKALKIIESKGGEAIIHCGDFVAPFMLKELQWNQIFFQESIF